MRGDRTTRILLLVTIALLCVNLVIMLGRPAQAQYRARYTVVNINPYDQAQANAALNEYAGQGYTVAAFSALSTGCAYVILRK